MLMDSWIKTQLGKDFDKNGAWAASAEVDEALLTQFMSDPFIRQTPPKSTGREHYHLEWLKQQLKSHEGLSAATVQATLCAFTANSIRYAIEQFLPVIETLIICGGGAHNQHLLNLLQQQLPTLKIQSSDYYGLHPDWVEAVAFAWLAQRTLAGLPGNLPAVTGASQATVLGAIYPA